jgi:hypothetical protein
MGKFRLVDFAAHYQKGFRNHIVALDEVPALIRSFNRFGCYSTYFFYSDDILSYMAARTDQASPSIAGYDGRVAAPFFAVDIDDPELPRALETTRWLSAYFLQRWQIEPAALQIYFSGSKGFHLMLDCRVFGRVAPARNLPLVFDALRRHLAQELPEQLRSALDLAIRDRVRLLRLPNTIHEKSKLYKRLLSFDEVQSLDTEEIKCRAQEPRQLELTDETGLIPRTMVAPNTEAAALYRRIHGQIKRWTRKPFRYRFARPENLDKIKFRCAGLEAIWESNIERGNRNNCAIRLASELRLMGLGADETLEKLLQWNAQNAIDLPEEEITSVVRSAFQHRYPYRYSCRDAVLRRFCPLSDYLACRAFVVQRNDPQRN